MTKKIVEFYFKNINTLRQNKNKSFAVSEKDGFVHKTTNANVKNKKEQTKQRYSDIKKSIYHPSKINTNSLV